MDRIHWMPARKNDDGVKVIGFKDMSRNSNVGRIVGFNGIVKGSKVYYKDEVHEVILVSRLGHFTLLDKKGNELKVKPKDVKFALE